MHSHLLALINSEFFGFESVCGAPIVSTEACEPAGIKVLGCGQNRTHTLCKVPDGNKKRKRNNQTTI